MGYCAQAGTIVLIGHCLGCGALCSGIGHLTQVCIVNGCDVGSVNLMASGMGQNAVVSGMEC